jgi:hypothetical protein
MVRLKLTTLVQLILGLLASHIQLDAAHGHNHVLRHLLVL